MGKSVLLHILDVNEQPILEQIYVSGTSDAVKEVIAELGGLAKASKRLSVKYSRLKEWVSGRRPIPIFFLKNIIELSNKRGRIIRRVNLGDIYISCKYSPHKIKFPKEVTKELAYIVGIILGDGCLAGDKNNHRGNWTITVCYLIMKYIAIYTAVTLTEFLELTQNIIGQTKDTMIAISLQKRFIGFSDIFLE